jgi:hypothetical protein
MERKIPPSKLGRQCLLLVRLHKSNLKERVEMKKDVNSYARILLPAMTLIIVGLLLTACTATNNSSNGGGGSGDVGPQAIINGQTLGSASTHWVSSNCGIPIDLELTLGDDGFKQNITDSNGYTHPATGNWTPSANGASATITYASGTNTADAVVSLINIAGSTSSAGFVAGVNTGYGISIPTCVFNLAGGGM